MSESVREVNEHDFDQVVFESRTMKSERPRLVLPAGESPEAQMRNLVPFFSPTSFLRNNTLRTSTGGEKDPGRSGNEMPAMLKR